MIFTASIFVVNDPHSYVDALLPMVKACSLHMPFETIIQMCTRAHYIICLLKKRYIFFCCISFIKRDILVECKYSDLKDN